EEQKTFARQAVAPRAARLLIVALDVLRQVVVHDEADIRFVDAHAKSDGCANDANLVPQEQFLICGARFRIETSVIRLRLYPVFVQTLCQTLRASTALTVNDAAVARFRLCELKKLPVRIVFR